MDFTKTCTAGKCIVAYTRHAAWNRDACQRETTIKCIDAYTRHVAWNRDACQRGTIIKCIIAYTRHAAWNRDACQRETTKKCIVVDADSVAKLNPLYTVLIASVFICYLTVFLQNL